MLSRVADAVFWMSRYIERAENVARFIDVNQAISLGGRVGMADQWAPLIYANGDEETFKELYGEFSRRNVLRFLTFDRRNPNSILSCAASARENARTIRDILSTPMWEAVNRFYLRM
ncbi:MAG: alpha-E domain-containing protein, partial [Planctomycetaceae bacterium]|nr:alpha-E domain-containing protein [Planctomycetaceae bacterium]